MCAACWGHGDRAVDEGPAPVELAREEGRVLVLGRHQHAAPLVRAEVAGGREADERAAARVAGVDDHVLVAAPGDPRVLDAEALRLRLDVGQQAPVGVDRPVLETVGAAGNAEMGEPGAVLDAREQERLAPRRVTPGLKTALTV